ncbi:EF-P 5-aminopentanol modification-associated protein YfmF [Schleiferilactobacillus shenzhenensis]|uniref:Peptidase M16 C-terminal domain-containing protein n=1 Tax=Schleiferilactobacillus shenzhenensis LY-73 TaxID=1231336 RepID=U4TXV7_9LACO|nr:insulinase family protein [Schleiferilactobacillus shenzhenensis]ERL66177.1 hypothetical protein L248_1269 [Schleiferilactobacillus shenzhenensis LY-73]
MVFSKMLRSGVRLTVVPSQKFKTVTATVNFIAPLQVATLTNRQLIANLWPVANAHYPTPRALTVALQDLYGASLRTGIDREGALSIATCQLQFLSDSVLPAGESILGRALALLQTICWQPLLDDQGYAAAFFTPERDNLAHELQSMTDSAENKAVLTAQAQYFQDAPEQAAVLAGTPATVAAATPQGLAAYWRTMAAHDEIEIVVTGAVSPDQVADLVAQWAVPARSAVTTPLQWQGTVPAPRRWQTPAAFQQSQYIAIYQLPVTYYGPSYFDYLVTDALFGGSANSLLFAAVREQAGLAYYAGTDFDAQTGATMLQAGIDPGTADQVRAIVKETLAQLAAGDFSPERLHSIQQELITNRLGEDDAQAAVNGRFVLAHRLPGADMTPAAFRTAVSAVTPAAIQACAGQYRLVVDYLQEGDARDGQ